MKKTFNDIDLVGKILFVVVIVFSVMGDGFKFYQKFFWWDLLVHFIAGICLASIGFGIAKGVPNLKLEQVLIFSFMFALTLHVAWELFEFTCDRILNSNMQRWHFDSNLPDTHVIAPGVIDTMTDFIANITGAIFMTAGYLFRYKRYKKD